MAIGADRAILVESTEELQPLAVAKMLKALVDKEQPQLIILGKQAIDDDSNQTGQMLAALAGLPQATFASKVTVADGKATVSREVDGGVGNAVADAARRDHHRFAPERAALRDAAEHHEGQEEADGNAQAGRPRCRRDAAPEDAQSRRAAAALRWREGAGREDAGREVEDRSQGAVREFPK